MERERRTAVLLCNDCATSRIVAQALAADGVLELILVVTNEGLGQKLRRRARRHGWPGVASQTATAVLARGLYRARGGPQRRRELLREIGFDDRWPPAVPRVAVGDVNGERCVSELRAAAPDVVVVNGTDIIRQHVFDAVDAPFVNLHTGITPAYRGVHGGFWALARGKGDDVGVTLHEVDAGIDTGRVLAQARAQPSERDGFLTLPLVQYRAGLPLLRAYVSRGTTTGELEAGDESRQWYHPGLRDYLRALIRRAVRY